MKAILLFLLIFGALCTHAQKFDIYVSDAGNFQNPPWQLLKFDEAGQNPSIFTNERVSWPQDILFLEDRNYALISNFGTNSIAIHDAVTGNYIRNFATGITGPTRLKIAKDSSLYVLQWNGNGRVRRYSLDGAYLGEFTKVGVPQSIGMDWDKEGNLYVSSYTAGIVRKYDPAGQDLGLFIQSNLVGPTNIWFNAKGDLMVLDYDEGTVKQFDESGNFKGWFIIGLKQCEGVAVLPDGDILIGNGGTGSVKQYDKTGLYKKDIILPGSGKLLTPNAVVLREQKTTSIQNETTAKSAFLIPGIGKQFQLHTDVDVFLSIDIYNSQGVIIESIVPGSSRIWDAESCSAGLYIAIFNDKFGKSRSQKLLVVK